MSLNKWMHPRNVFRSKPDFKVLGQEFPEFEPFLKRFHNGNVTIDYKNPAALRTLCQVLLKKYFSLDVYIPPNRLIPAVPQRLNYVLWIEDLVSLLDTPLSENIRGIDLGTGSTCILPFLMCRNNRSWKIQAIEIDSESYSVATRNVAHNDLSNRIAVHLNQDNPSKFSWIFHSIDDNRFQFLVCNPPFFKKQNHQSDLCEFVEEMDKRSTSNESVEIESSFDGGEVKFVEEMIIESLIVGTQIKIYSVMLGKKSSLISLKKVVKSHLDNGQISSFATTEFCQGRTMRWGLAWTCVPNLELSQIPKFRQKRQKKVSFEIGYKKGLDYSIEGIADILRKLVVDELNVELVEETPVTKLSYKMTLRSNTNSWSHQRRKRRQGKKQVDNGSNLTVQNGVETLKRKRHVISEDEDDAPQSPLTCYSKRVRDVQMWSGLECEINFLLDATLTLRKEGKSIILSLVPGDRCSNGESVHQLLQYFRNKFTVHPATKS